MKALVCEMCNSKDLVKVDEYFVCQYCGCKYGKEEAKKLMIELSGTVKIDETDKIKDYLKLSFEARKSGNDSLGESYKYAMKALEISPENSKAWVAKLKSIKYVSNFNDLKVVETIDAGNNAIRYADEEFIEYDVYSYYFQRASELLQQSLYNINNVSGIEILIKNNTYVKVYNNRYIKKINYEKVYNQDFNVVRNYNIMSNAAISLLLAIPNDKLAQYDDLVKILYGLSNTYDNITSSMISRVKIYNGNLDANIQNSRNINSNNIKLKIQQVNLIKNYREDCANKKRIKEYWDEHQEVYDKLMEQKNDLEKQIANLENERDSSNLFIERNKISEEINSLNIKRKNTSLTDMKTKSELKKQINEMQDKYDHVNIQITELYGSYENKIYPLKDKLSTIDYELFRNR